jgi:AAA domain
MSVSAEERMGRAGGRSERWDRGKATNGNGQEKQSRTRGRIKALTLEELESLPKRDYLLKGLISRGEISIWVGPPKCGKSFLLLFVAYMLAQGKPMFGRRVKPARVLYVAAEGTGGIAKRIEALKRKYGSTPNLKIIAQRADMLNEDGSDLADVEAEAQDFEADLIVIDTVSRVLAGGDENSPQDMGRFVVNITDLRDKTGAHVALVHHGTKSSNGASPRGHSCLTGADDALVEVAKSEDGSRSATVVHSKDDADGIRWGFKLELVELDEDEDGDPITTLIVQETEAPPIVAKAKLTDQEVIGLDALRDAIRQTPITINGDTTAGEPAQLICTTKDAWRAAFKSKRPNDKPDTVKHAFDRMHDSLLRKHEINSRDGYAWLAAGHDHPHEARDMAGHSSGTWRDKRDMRTCPKRDKRDTHL